MTVADQKFVALTTYRRNGESSSTPVWIVDLGDGTLGFTTPSSSLKVTRLGNDPRVILQPSDQRGRIIDGSTAVTGTAVVSTADFDRVRAAIKRKYGWQVAMVQAVAVVAKLFGRDRTSDAAVIITLD
jgi:PPOX class probable F420-dependent enzyme